ncbi:MAG TPA: ABC transporter permease [Kofleriaceae bacterium]|jgi:ABC-2 type transport system permease protein|nr:ABC transporter permease [Kofleriaceae bacterium]
METVAVAVPPRSFRSDLRAVRIVWYRDVIRFWRDKPRIIASLLQPVLYMFVFGTGMGRSMTLPGDLDLRQFFYPGVMAMATLFTCFFSAGSIVWDREFGFMREMLVAPVRRGAIVVGKALGGATAGMTQGVLVLALGPLVGIPFSPLLVLVLLAQLALLSFTITAIGVMVAVRIRSFPAFMALVQIIIMPMFFLSGALFPLRNLPGWLHVATLLDPMTYAVDPLRREVLGGIAGGSVVAPGVTWSGWVVPPLVELGIVAGTGLLCLAIATRAIQRIE